MNRKGGFNRPLDFIAWKYQQLIVIPKKLTFCFPLTIVDDVVVLFAVISNLFCVMQQLWIHPFYKWKHTCK